MIEPRRTAAKEDTTQSANTWRKQDFLALIILFLAVSVFHAAGIRSGQTFLPVDLANLNQPWRESSGALQNWLISDPLYQFYPFLVNTVDTIRHTGRWPLWNPHILLGHSVVGDPLTQPFYPVFVALGLIFGAARGLAIGLWFHVVLAAVLTYGFLRTIGCRWRASILGALTYALSGYLVTWFETTFWISTLAWLPGILWAFELAIQRRRWRYVALSALMMAFAILGGQFSFAVTFGLFLALYSLSRTWSMSRQAGRVSGWPLAVLAMTLGLGFLVSAIQTVPFAEFLGMSRRVLERGLSDPLPWRQLVTLMVPDFYGNPASGGPYWGAMNYSEGTIYAGLVALSLACMAPLVSRRIFVLHMLAVGLLVTYFVVSGPGVALLGGMPIIKYISLHRTTFLLPLIIALLAAEALSEPKMPIWAVVGVGIAATVIVYGAVQLNWGQAQDHWRQLNGVISRAALLLGVTIVLLALRDRYPRLRPATEWGLIALVFVDLYLFGGHFNPVGPVAKLLKPTPGIQYLRTHAGLDRVLAYQRDNSVMLGPNIASIYGLSEAGGYSSLISRRFHQVIAAGDPKLDVSWMNRDGNMITFSFPSRRLLDLLGVKYLISPESFTDPSIRAETITDTCERDSGEIAATRVVSGTFTVRDTAINRLDLRFRVLRPEQPKGVVLLRMWRGSDRAHLVVDTRLKTADLTDGKTTVYFSPEREAPGQTYTWEVSPDGTGNETGVALCASADRKAAISVYGADGTQAYEGEMYVFERLSPVPRAYVVYAAEHIPDDGRAVSRLLDDAFDVRNVAVTAESLDLPSSPAIPASRASITDYEDTRVTIRASAAQPGLLVLADQFHPGWRAYLDGRSVRTFRINQFQRGVLLPPGDHEVVFEFAPSSLTIGAGLTLGGLITLMVMLLLDLRLYRTEE